MPYPYYNALAPVDVTRDWAVTPRDALHIINQINNGGARPLDLVNVPEAANRSYVDTNGDNQLTPIDALLVINCLNRGEALDNVVGFRLELQNASGVPITPLKDAQGNTVYDADGDPILPVRIGDPFRVQLYVDDLRGPSPNGNGVFSATLDVAYSTPQPFSLGGTKPDDFTSLTDFRSFFRATTPYNQAALTVWPSVMNIDGDGVPNEFDELGTYAPYMDAFDPVSLEEMRFVYVTLTADPVAKYSKVTFSANPSDFPPPGNDVLVMGDDLPIDANLIDFGLPLHVTVVLPVNAQNDAFPVPPAQILEDSGPVDLNVLANDFLGPGSTGTLALKPTGLTQPANGQVSVVGDKVRYKPNADFFGTDMFTYTVVDGLGNSDTGTVTVTVLSVNDPPVAVNDAFTVLEDSVDNVLNVLANDNAGPANEDQTLTINPATLTQPTHGTVTLIAGNTLVQYTPHADFFGTDSFRYSVFDSDGLESNLATVTITVQNVNDAPVAVDDFVSGILEDSVDNPIDVLANDSPGINEGQVDHLTIISTQNFSAGGSATIRPDGQLLFYRPAPNFFGTETFFYTVQDRGGLQATAMVTVAVVNVNDPVTAVDDQFFVGEFTTDNELDVLANDLAGPNEQGIDDLRIVAVTVPDAHGTVAISPDGKLLIYSPDLTALGPYTETFQYTMTDGPTQDTATVTVLVEPVTRPRARDDKYTVLEDSLATDPGNTLRVLDNDLFNEGATRTVFMILDDPEHSYGPFHGTALVVGDAIRYQPDPDFFGTDTFSYIIDDNYVDEDGNPSQPSIGVVTIIVLPVNDAPTANDDTFTAILEDSVNNVLDVLANDTFAPDEGETLTIVAVGSNPAGDNGLTAQGGTVSIFNGVRVLYTPAPDFFGTDTFRYTITDGNGGYDTATVTIEVVNVNDAPTANDDVFEGILEDSVNNPLDVLANDTFAPDEGETLTIIAVGSNAAGDNGLTAQGGTVTIQNDELVLYTPAPDFFGLDTFTYWITDGNGGFDSATVLVQVLDVNDAPTANDDELMALKDFANQTLDVLANDSVAPDREEDEVLTIIGLGPLNEASITTLHGTATIAADGKAILYTPNPGFESEGVNLDVFTYTISDGRGGTDSATVTVDVIDAVPSTISGMVYLDVNNNGIKDATEVAVAGVEVTLRGTNIRGQSLNLTVKTDVNGVFRFENILPNLEGSLEGYSIAAAQPKFLIDGKDTILDGIVDDDLDPGLAQNDLFTGIQLGLWGTTRADGNYLFGERGLSSKFITIAQYLASTRKGLAAATNLAGDDYWFTVLQGWEGIKSCHVQLASDLASARLTVVDASGQTHVRTIDYTKYHLAGDRNTGEYMIYFNGSAADLGFDLAANGASQAEGEPEAGSAEMYAADFARGADEVFSRGDWA